MGWSTVTVSRRRERLPARYWRLRFADDCDERVAELDLDPDLDWYDYADRFDPCDPREDALDSAIADLVQAKRACNQEPSSLELAVIEQ